MCAIRALTGWEMDEVGSISWYQFDWTERKALIYRYPVILITIAIPFDFYDDKPSSYEEGGRRKTGYDRQTTKRQALPACAANARKYKRTGFARAKNRCVTMYFFDPKTEKGHFP